MGVRWSKDRRVSWIDMQRKKTLENECPLGITGCSGLCSESQWSSKFTVLCSRKVVKSIRRSSRLSSLISYILSSQCVRTQLSGISSAYYLRSSHFLKGRQLTC